MANQNNEKKTLEKITLLILILTAIIAPWLYHDRAITRIETQLDAIKEKVDNIEATINGRVMVLPDKGKSLEVQ